MEIMTVEQAREAAKGLTFEDVWEALMEGRRQMAAYDKRMEDLSKNLGGLGNSIGELVEEMFRAELCDKFTELGFTVHEQANSKRIYKDGRVAAETDALLENGDYIILVEIKTKLTVEDVNDHIERIETVRICMDERNDFRKIIGAVAGGVVPKNVIRYAQKKGFYVLTQSGDSAAFADMPKGFKPREWGFTG